ncbi:conserved hypothetical protein [Neospora caninum Liverpool]|uniref:Myb-like domain-containing protein n=1 Tax=Neospora caninum (strain Liverpool) TaxID=572307 RepID=F0V9V6_NEOCL|nr:conserved hypothetical protein [Neospora caninum Liverpool]CBZ50718.1 conserved hypothetical protein [Neospora caninum Liverpool]|eukprot:XP_003880751.1 conserved hypothetical protein [Neospora caninum Liverpool]
MSLSLPTSPSAGGRVRRGRFTSAEKAKILQTLEEYAGVWGYGSVKEAVIDLCEPARRDASKTAMAKRDRFATLARCLPDRPPSSVYLFVRRTLCVALQVKKKGVWSSEEIKTLIELEKELRVTHPGDRFARIAETLNRTACCVYDKWKELQPRLLAVEAETKLREQAEKRPDAEGERETEETRHSTETRPRAAGEEGGKGDGGAETRQPGEKAEGRGREARREEMVQYQALLDSAAPLPATTLVQEVSSERLPACGVKWRHLQSHFYPQSTASHLRLQYTFNIVPVELARRMGVPSALPVLLRRAVRSMYRRLKRETARAHGRERERQAEDEEAVANKAARLGLETAESVEGAEDAKREATLCMQAEESLSGFTDVACLDIAPYCPPALLTWAFRNTVRSLCPPKELAKRERRESKAAERKGPDAHSETETGGPPKGDNGGATAGEAGGATEGESSEEDRKGSGKRLKDYSAFRRLKYVPGQRLSLAQQTRLLACHLKMLGKRVSKKRDEYLFLRGALACEDFAVAVRRAIRRRGASGEVGRDEGDEGGPDERRTGKASAARRNKRRLRESDRKKLKKSRREREEGEGERTEGGETEGEGERTEGGETEGEGERTEGGETEGEGERTEGGETEGGETEGEMTDGVSGFASSSESEEEETEEDWRCESEEREKERHMGEEEKQRKWREEARQLGRRGVLALIRKKGSKELKRLKTYNQRFFTFGKKEPCSYALPPGGREQLDSAFSSLSMEPSSLSLCPSAARPSSPAYPVGQPRQSGRRRERGREGREGESAETHAQRLAICDGTTDAREPSPRGEEAEEARKSTEAKPAEGQRREGKVNGGEPEGKEEQEGDEEEERDEGREEGGDEGREEGGEREEGDEGSEEEREGDEGRGGREDRGAEREGEKGGAGEERKKRGSARFSDARDGKEEEADGEPARREDTEGGESECGKRKVEHAEKGQEGEIHLTTPLRKRRRRGDAAAGERESQEPVRGGAEREAEILGGVGEGESDETAGGEPCDTGRGTNKEPRKDLPRSPSISDTRTEEPEDSGATGSGEEGETGGEGKRGQGDKPDAEEEREDDDREREVPGWQDEEGALRLTISDEEDEEDERQEEGVPEAEEGEEEEAAEKDTREGRKKRGGEPGGENGTEEEAAEKDTREGRKKRGGEPGGENGTEEEAAEKDTREGRKKRGGEPGGENGTEEEAAEKDTREGRKKRGGEPGRENGTEEETQEDHEGDDRKAGGAGDSLKQQRAEKEEERRQQNEHEEGESRGGPNEKRRNEAKDKKRKKTREHRVSSETRHCFGEIEGGRSERDGDAHAESARTAEEDEQEEGEQEDGAGGHREEEDGGTTKGGRAEEDRSADVGRPREGELRLKKKNKKKKREKLSCEEAQLPESPSVAGVFEAENALASHRHDGAGDLPGEKKTTVGDSAVCMAFVSRDRDREEAEGNAGGESENRRVEVGETRKVEEKEVKKKKKKKKRSVGSSEDRACGHSVSACVDGEAGKQEGRRDEGARREENPDRVQVTVDKVATQLLASAEESAWRDAPNRAEEKEESERTLPDGGDRQAAGVTDAARVKKKKRKEKCFVDDKDCTKDSLVPTPLPPERGESFEAQSESQEQRVERAREPQVSVKKKKKKKKKDANEQASWERSEECAEPQRRVSVGDHGEIDESTRLKGREEGQEQEEREGQADGGATLRVQTEKRKKVHFSDEDVGRNGLEGEVSVSRGDSMSPSRDGALPLRVTPGRPVFEPNTENPDDARGGGQQECVSSVADACAAEAKKKKKKKEAESGERSEEGDTEEHLNGKKEPRKHKLRKGDRKHRDYDSHKKGDRTGSREDKTAAEDSGET